MFIPEGMIFLPKTKAWFKFKVGFVLSSPDLITEEIVSGYEELLTEIHLKVS